MPPNFKPTKLDEQTASANSEQRTALDAKPRAVGLGGTKTRRVRGGTVAKADHAALVADRKAARSTGGRPRTSTRDALVALQYTELAKAAPRILQRLVAGALDPADPYHERCLDLVAKRIMPLAFWEGLSKQEFREDGEGGKGPTFVINVGTAEAPTIEVVPRERRDEE